MLRPTLTARELAAYCQALVDTGKGDLLVWVQAQELSWMYGPVCQVTYQAARPSEDLEEELLLHYEDTDLVPDEDATSQEMLELLDEQLARLRGALSNFRTSTWKQPQVDQAVLETFWMDASNDLSEARTLADLAKKVLLRERHYLMREAKRAQTPEKSHED